MEYAVKCLEMILAHQAPIMEILRREAVRTDSMQHGKALQSAISSFLSILPSEEVFSQCKSIISAVKNSIYELQLQHKNQSAKNNSIFRDKMKTATKMMGILGEYVFFVHEKDEVLVEEMILLVSFVLSSSISEVVKYFIFSCFQVCFFSEQIMKYILLLLYFIHVNDYELYCIVL